jgi:hypothetical protein
MVCSPIVPNLLVQIVDEIQMRCHRLPVPALGDSGCLWILPVACVACVAVAACASTRWLRFPVQTPGRCVSNGLVLLA